MWWVWHQMVQQLTQFGACILLRRVCELSVAQGSGRTWRGGGWKSDGGITGWGQGWHTTQQLLQLQHVCVCVSVCGCVLALWVCILEMLAWWVCLSVSLSVCNQGPDQSGALPFAKWHLCMAFFPNMPPRVPVMAVPRSLSQLLNLSRKSGTFLNLAWMAWMYR